MKTDSLISNLAPATKSDQKAPDRLVDPFAKSSIVSKGPSFTDYLKPQAHSAPIARKATPQRQTPKHEPSRAHKPEAPQKNESKPLDRKDRHAENNQNESSRARRKDGDQSEAVNRYNERKKARARQAEKSSGKNEVAKKTDETNAQAVDGQAAATTGAKPTSPKNNDGVIDTGTSRKLQQALGAGEELTKHVPALAIVTGHLENVKPDAIPKIVSSNTFMQEAFATADVETFLNQPQSLAGILGQLGVTETDIDKLQSFGIDIAIRTTPKELLGKLGLDIQRIGTELEILKDNVAMPSGLSAYIARAQKLQGKQYNGPTSAEAHKGNLTVMNEENLQTSSPQKKAVSPSTIQRVPSSEELLSQQPGMVRKRGAASEMTSLQQTITPDSQIETSEGGKLENLATATTAAPVNLNPEKSYSLMNQPIAAASVETGDLQTSTPKLPLNELPIMELAGEEKIPVSPMEKGTLPSDRMMRNVLAQASNVTSHEEGLFGSFTQKTAALDTQTIAVDNLPVSSEQPVEEAQLETTAWQPSTSTPMMEKGKMARDVSIESAESNEPTSFDMRFSEYNNNNQLGQASKSTYTSGSQVVPQNMIGHTIQPTLPTESVQQNHIERMAASALGVRFAPENSSNGSNMNQDSSSQQNPQDSKGSLDLLTAAGISKTAAQKTSAAGFEKHMKLEAHNPVTHQVIDRARMMVKEGGGEVLLDLGSKSLGKVELAMNVSNDRVELKIIAANDQVRELLTQDLGALREALAVQDLNLSEVEVAVGNGESQYESLADQQEQSQEQMNFAEKDGDKNGQNSSKSKQGTPVASRRLSTTQHQGSIAVRV